MSKRKQVEIGTPCFIKMVNTAHAEHVARVELMRKRRHLDRIGGALIVTGVVLGFIAFMSPVPFSFFTATLAGASFIGGCEFINMEVR